MSEFDVKEKRFEQDIEEYLISEGGYQKGNPQNFDRKLALDTKTFVEFLRTSQPKEWERYEKIYGADSEKQVVERFCRETAKKGLLAVLRKGFTDRGIKFRAVFWKPETLLNVTTLKQYQDNVFHCTRQLHYSLTNENSIDIVLFINGIPVVSMELKCQFTGQNTANAINQYKFDRAGKDAIFKFKERVLVHFAVDLNNVYMTTKLEGEKTYFLPFNQGSNGAGEIGGRAKAMLVTPSRLHAVRYLQEFKRQIADKQYDLDVLVAFSGEVVDKGETYTEEMLNTNKAGETIKEKALPEAFHGDEFGMLIVAEKYQTGFDEPLLHTMFIDKKLSGVKAVQTLSRLNRTMPGKHDTFVLDFVNTEEDIKDSFEPFYEEAFLEKETDPNIVYDLKNTLDEYRVYQETEIEKFSKIFFSGKKQTRGDLGKLQAQIQPAVNRFQSLEQEQQDLFKSTLTRFNRMYAFVTQICRLFDKEIHKFSVYAKFLAKYLPKGTGEVIEVDDKVMLEYYRLEKDFDGEINLESNDKGFTAPTGDAGRVKDKKKDPLADIISKINEHFGTEFTEMDKVLLQLENDYAAQEKWRVYAQNNDYQTFKLLFEKEFPEMAASRYEQNDMFFVKLFSDPVMMQQVISTLCAVLYERLSKRQIRYYGVPETMEMVAEENNKYGK